MLFLAAMNVGAYPPSLFLLFAAGALSCTAQSREQSPHVQAASAPRGDTSGASASLAEAERRALTPVTVEGQPLAANVLRLIEALDYLGAPLPGELRSDLTRAGRARDATRLQELLDPQVLLVVHINPEARVKVARGPAHGALQQAGYTPVLIKIVNESRGTQRLRIASPQAGPVYAGMSSSPLSGCNSSTFAKTKTPIGAPIVFSTWKCSQPPPMTANLSGLEAEYALALIYSSESGRREATLTFDVGQGTAGPRLPRGGACAVRSQPAIAVKLRCSTTMGRRRRRVFSSWTSKVMSFRRRPSGWRPICFSRQHIYRAHGEDVLLPPGELTMFFGRGPDTGGSNAP